MISGENFELYRRYRALSQLLDAAVRVPGTQVRFGLDFVAGLLPGIGDLATGALGTYGLYVAQRLGAPRSLLLRMAGNLAIDTVVGAVPVLGDLFDLHFRANLRNLALLDRWIDAPGPTHRASRALVAALGLGLLALAGLLIWAIAAAIVALVN